MLSDIDPPRFEPVSDARPDDVPWPDMQWPPPADRLVGRLVTLDKADAGRDAAEVFTALGDPELWRHIRAGAPRDAADLAARFEADVAAGHIPWTMRLAAPIRGMAVGAAVGTTAYRDVHPRHARLEIGSTTYARYAWGSGVNADAKLLLFAYAFDELKAGRVHLVTDPRNHRSQQAIARLGAVYEGTLRRHDRRADGTVRDTVMFSVIAEEWPAVRARLEARVEAAVRELG